MRTYKFEATLMKGEKVNGSIEAPTHVEAERIIREMNCTINHVQKLDIPDVRVFKLLKTLGLEPATIFDVGASTSTWSESLCQVFPEARFELFEPLADHVEKYRLGMESALKAHPNFRLHKVAFGRACQDTTMYVSPDAWGSSTLGALWPEPVTVKTQMLTVDGAIKALNLPAPDVIKMDIQGGELAVLMGAEKTLPHVEVLLCECWLILGYGEQTPLLLELSDWLAEFDIYLWDVGDTYRDPGDGTLVTLDCYFLNARSKISPLKGILLKNRRKGLVGPLATPARGSWLQRIKALLRGI